MVLQPGCLVLARLRQPATGSVLEDLQSTRHTDLWTSNLRGRGSMGCGVVAPDLNSGEGGLVRRQGRGRGQQTSAILPDG